MNKGKLYVWNEKERKLEGPHVVKDKSLEIRSESFKKPNFSFTEENENNGRKDSCLKILLSVLMIFIAISVIIFIIVMNLAF